MSTGIQPTMSDIQKTFKLGGDLEINRLGFGAMRIVGDGVWGEPKDLENAKKVLQRAVELGVNFIDTSDAYGPAVSERLIGEALAPYNGPNGKVVIAPKADSPARAPTNGSPSAAPNISSSRSN